MDKDKIKTISGRRGRKPRRVRHRVSQAIRSADPEHIGEVLDRIEERYGVVLVGRKEEPGW